MRVSRADGAQWAYENSLAAKWKRVRFKDNRLPETKQASVAAFECWCGQGFDHDWPGKDEGAPHPVPQPERPTPPRVAEREALLALQEAGVCPVCRGYPKNPLGGRLKDRPFCRTCQGTGEFPAPSTAELIRREKAARSS